MKELLKVALRLLDEMSELRKSVDKLTAVYEKTHTWPNGTIVYPNMTTSVAAGGYTPFYWNVPGNTGSTAGEEGE